MSLIGLILFVVVGLALLVGLGMALVFKAIAAGCCATTTTAVSRPNGVPLFGLAMAALLGLGLLLMLARSTPDPFYNGPHGVGFRPAIGIAVGPLVLLGGTVLLVGLLLVRGRTWSGCSEGRERLHALQLPTATAATRTEMPPAGLRTPLVVVWPRGLVGLGLAALPAAAIWGGGLLALQATPQEAVTALRVFGLGEPVFVEPVLVVDAVTKTESLPVPTDDRTVAAAERPSWIREAAETSGDRQRQVLASRLYTTVAEAEQELQVQTTALVRTDLRQHDPLARQATLKNLGDATVQSLVVTQRYSASEEKDFGSFTAPMHRVWWEVQIDDHARSQLAIPVRAEVARGRLLVGVWGLALVTLLAGTFLAVSVPRDLTTPRGPASLMTA